MADIDNVNSVNNDIVNNNSSIQSDPVNLIQSAMDPKTGAVDTRQLAADVSGAKDFQAASQSYEQIEAELSRQDPKLAAQFSRDVADAFATRNSAAQSGQGTPASQGTTSGVSASDTGNDTTPQGLRQLLENKGITVPQDVPASTTATAASAPEGASSYKPPTEADVPTNSLKFLQKDVKNETTDGVPLSEVERSMRENGWDIQKGSRVDVVQGLDKVVSPQTGDPESLATVDTRRVRSAAVAEVPTVPATIHDPNEPLTGENVGRFTLKDYAIRRLDNGELVAGGNKGEVVFPKGSVATTWGEAGLFRAANQGNVKGEGRFPLSGSSQLPKVRPGDTPSTAAANEGTASAAPKPPSAPAVNEETTSIAPKSPLTPPVTEETASAASKAPATTAANEGTFPSVKQGTVFGAAAGGVITAGQLALAGKLNLQNLGEVAKGTAEGGAIGALATKGEQLLTPVIDRAIGGAVQKGASQLAATVAGDGVADAAGVAARTLATRAAGGTVVGAGIAAGISAWDNRAGLVHGDSKAIGNVAADTTVAAGSIVASMAVGAAVGSAVPIAGTAVGAVVGLAVGVGITYGAQISGARDAIANGVAHGVDGIKDAAKSIGNFFGF